VILVPVIEEVLWRLFFFDALLIRTLRVRVWLALAAQAIVFSWLHFFLGESYAAFRDVEEIKRPTSLGLDCQIQAHSR